MTQELVRQGDRLAGLKGMLAKPTVKKQFQNALADNANLFMASVIELVSSDKGLRACNPGELIREALKAAVLNLPLNKQLGLAYLVPFKDNRSKTVKPTFIIGYKGLIQLATRTGRYSAINADAVYEGEVVIKDRITGDITIEGEPTSETTIGYFGYIGLTNGFKKVIYKTKEEIVAHAKKYSKAYNSSYSPWKTDFDIMAKKTLLREIIGTYGIKSVEFLKVENAEILDRKNNIQVHEVEGTSVGPTNEESVVKASHPLPKGQPEPELEQNHLPPEPGDIPEEQEEEPNLPDEDGPGF